MAVIVGLNNKEHTVNAHSLIQVQLGKNRSAYRTKWSFIGEAAKAVKYYRCLNVGYGYKKRLVLDGKVIAKTIT